MKIIGILGSTRKEGNTEFLLDVALIGDTFVYETPYKKPENGCTAILHVLDLSTWRVALGFPSWNSENRKVFKIHCPDPKGTVWEMRKILE